MTNSFQSRPTLALLVIFTTLFRLASAANNTKCYAPNGQEAQYTDVRTNQELFACPAGDDGFATCCVSTDFCHPDNLCYNLNDGFPTVYRQYCTDQTWDSDNCSPLCRTAGEENASVTGAVGLTPCSDGKFCCGTFNDDCCNNHAGLYAIQGTQVGPGKSFTTTATSAATASSASSDTISGDVTASASPSSSAESTSAGISSGAIAGVAVGTAGVVAIFALAGVLFWRRRKSRTSPQDPGAAAPSLLPPSTHHDSYPPSWSPQHSYQPTQHYMEAAKPPSDVYGHEGMGRRRTPEMEEVPVRHELQSH
ncbi:hypothetical protein PFICI_11102 [Pestalotiopsis fici W106-1]|uniref:Mid2 domain-containing protein n=1 Tax=Pestalotiopsis fici (strain W106-1 / CGMCC3.15140) TaxID=1229662 RepID=W3WTQ2_PESFW|nr:uncharacterized protein PFICI_11102 [Pestalotiopsis fici W106-1]ETS77228.1 hypothetical protein PFICI_11102 [Pestalotiopsis fici W106-1]